MVPLYFAALRPVVERDGVLIMVDDDRLQIHQGEQVRQMVVRLPNARLLPSYRRHRIPGEDGSPRSSGKCCSRTSERQGRVIDYDEAS